MKIQLLLLITLSLLLSACEEQEAIAVGLLASDRLELVASAAEPFTAIHVQEGPQLQAMQLTFFFFLPSLLLSGFMFPFDGMLRAAQTIAEVLPMTHFMRLIRGIILRGADIESLGSELLALLVFMLLTLTFAILRFSKRLG